MMKEAFDREEKERAQVGVQLLYTKSQLNSSTELPRH